MRFRVIAADAGTCLPQHADRGSQYAVDDDRELLGAAGMRQSMSRRRHCLGNAPMESVFPPSR
ncbi:hypothetical protein [Pseudoroseomonas ludipueritiae]|uniref:hypothetical protein n=1 Tax=Pseudoroseomonas ludipueritiae TaxID=198093 RepID=UPI003640B508